MINIERGRGFYDNGSQVLTFEVQGMAERDCIYNQENRTFYDRHLAENRTLRVGEYIVPIWGEEHNLYPQEVADIISANKLLPELIEKQVRYLFGKGPYLYRREDQNGRIRRVPVMDQPQIVEWLEGWEKNGLPESYQEYLIRCIRDYYHVETVVTKFHFNRSRRAFNPTLPVAGLEFIGTEDARLASTNADLANGYKKVKDGDCTYVMVGDWLNPIRQEFNVYPRFNVANPYASGISISWVKNRSFTKDLYAYNLWFRGLKDWIKGANLNPKYINSYLKNALNARIHVIIPGVWYEKKRGILEDICRKNVDFYNSDKPMQMEYDGVRLVDGNNVPYEFSHSMINELINNEMRKITDYLSGEGKNQGKIFSSISWTTGAGEAEKWEFQEIPSKYKEFIQALLEYDKRADEVILAGKGVDPSLSNVSESGTVSKSGSEVYYNYLIYINQLDIPEQYCTLDINRAIELNFPEAYRSGIRLGFYHEIPARQQDTTPNDRLTNNAAQS